MYLYKMWVGKRSTVLQSRSTFGVVKANVLTNVGGKDAAIGLAVGVASFDLHSFYATPVLVDTLRLTLKGVTVKGVGIAAGFDIVNPQRTLVSRGQTSETCSDAIWFSAPRVDHHRSFLTTGAAVTGHIGC